MRKKDKPGRGQGKPEGNRRYKDSVFRLLYREKRELLELYNAVNRTHYTEEEELEAVPLSRDEMFLRVRNDVSCIIDFRLNLYEHQSTYNPNMPVRALLYVANIYHEWMNGNHLDMHSNKEIKIPTPRFFVFYNGTEERPDVEEHRLSDLFYQKDREPKLELIVAQYNINAGHNEELLESCATLKGYASFVDRVRKNHVSGQTVDESVESAVDACIREDVLADFFREHYKEVVKMGKADFWEELHERTLFQNGRMEGIQEGMEKGLEKGIKKGLEKGLEKGLRALVTACKELNVNYEAVLVKIKEGFDMDEATAKENLDKYW